MRSTRIITPDAATVRLESLCARSEQCTYDLRQKLLRWGLAAHIAAEIVADLESRRYVDDSRFARALVADKYRFNRWGRLKIRAALIAKRIPSDLVEEALEGIDEDIYRDNLVELLRIKVKALGAEADTYEGRGKLLRYGASRGYEPALVVETIKKRLPWGSDTD